MRSFKSWVFLLFDAYRHGRRDALVKKRLRIWGFCCAFGQPRAFAQRTAIVRSRQGVMSGDGPSLSTMTDWFVSSRQEVVRHRTVRDGFTGRESHSARREEMNATPDT